MPEYRYEKYNFQYPDAQHEAISKMAGDGWHVHTAMPAYTELYILWERGGSALANRVSRHLELAQQHQEAGEEDRAQDEAQTARAEVEEAFADGPVLGAEKEQQHPGG